VVDRFRPTRSEDRLARRTDKYSKSILTALRKAQANRGK
jgi:hypothetical protein